MATIKGSKVLRTFSLDFEVSDALDEFAEVIGMSNSMAANMLLRAALTRDTGEMMKEIIDSAIAAKAAKKGLKKEPGNKRAYI